MADGQRWWRRPLLSWDRTWLGVTAIAVVTEIGNGTLVYHASVTISRALTGFLLAALVGIPFAAAMARSVLVRNLFEPIFFIGYPIPKIALFPVFTYVFGIGTPSKIAFTFIECLYPIVVACYFGFRAVHNKVHIHDLHATILHLLGIEHTKLTYRFQGRDFRLTDVHGNLISKLLA